HSFPTLRSSDLHRIDDSGDLMSRHPRVLDAGRGAFLCNGIGVTNTACFNLDAHRSNAGLRNFTLNELQGTLGTSHLHNTHLRHTSSDASFIKRVSANFEASATVVPGFSDSLLGPQRGWPAPAFATWFHQRANAS